MKRYYCGLFPPPYGGVTMKNDLLYNELQKKIHIKKIDIQKAKRRPDLLIAAVVKIVFARKSSWVIALSSRGRKSMTSLMYAFNKRSMRNSILLVMGGTFSKKIKNDTKYAKKLKCYKSIYVETLGMKNELISCGFENVKMYPNCRKRVDIKGIKPTKSDVFRCLFFSRISKEKGVDIILDAAKKLDNICFDFYGEIDESYQIDFEEQVSSLSNVTYQGVYRQNQSETINLIHEYDVLLLPTRWKNEGVPGILIEAKFAGVPAIVSDICYNSEIVMKDEGIVLEHNDSDSLIDAIIYMKNNPQMTDSYKTNSYLSSKRYEIDSYIEEILNDLR